MTKSQIISFLKKTYLFGEVSAGKLATAAKFVKENTFEKSDIIFNEGEKGDTLHIIKKGTVKITKYTKDGKTKTLAILKEGDGFGEMALLTKEVRSATVEALEKVVTVSITKESFEYLIKREPSISLQIIKSLSDRLAKADRDIKNLALGDANSRVAYVLMDFSEEMKVLKFTHQEIADLAGLTRETTTRTLRHMEKEKVIRIQDRKIKISNLEKLKEMCL